MKNVMTTVIIVFALTSCQSQTRSERNQKVGGPCEGCEAIYEYGEKVLAPVDTLPLFKESEPKLKISGTVFEKDGKTPAANVILYIYHTNRDGIYQTKGDEKGWARRHGFIRGWIKTGKDGSYTFYTFRPAGYPDRTDPEHIHITVKEPDKNEYYIDEFVFDDDPRLTAEKRRAVSNRGGSGISKIKFNGKIDEVTRDIVLGQSIPNY